MDNGMVTGAVFIDLTKAFDTVNHSILLSKLNSLGVLDDSTAYKWFEPYLSNRCQITACNNNSQLDQAIVPIGVPQGLPCTSMTYQTFWNTVTLLYMLMTLCYLFLPNPFIASNKI